MAAAFFNRMSAQGWHAVSGGTAPAARVQPEVVLAMREKGIDLGDAKPRLLTPAMLEDAQRLISMGCSVEEACPAVRVPMEDWGLPDPAGKGLNEVRRIRDAVLAKVEQFVASL